MDQLVSVDLLLSLVLALIMFSIGATLRFTDFRRTFWYPRNLVFGLVLQMMFLPVLTFTIVSFLNIDPLWKVGFVIVSLCPGGTTSNFISYLVNADVALSIALTSINSFLILVTIPFGTDAAISYFLGETSTISLPFWDTLLQVVKIILLPAFAGLLFNQYFPTVARKARSPLKIINAVLLALVFGYKYFNSEAAGGAGLNFEELKTLLPIALIIHIASLIISYGIARTFVSRRTSALTIGIEVGLQNTGLALFIASVVLANNELSKPALVYALFSFFTTLIFAALIYRYVILVHRKKYGISK